MRINFLLGLIICVFLGFSLNTPTNSDTSKVTQEKIKKFESEIVIKDNEYENETAIIETNTFNNTGKKVEKYIDKGFDYLFGFLKGYIDDEKD